MLILILGKDFKMLIAALVLSAISRWSALSWIVSRLSASLSFLLYSQRIRIDSFSASAKVIPSNIGYKYKEFVVFLGMAFIIVGASNSKISSSFKPITNNKDAIAIVKYPPSADAKTFPVNAQAMPIRVNTIAVPNIKQQSCKKVVQVFSLE